MKNLVVSLLAAAAAATANAQPTTSEVAGLGDVEIVELTHPLDATFPYIPVPGITFPFALKPIATLEKQNVAANAWQVHEHLGTQIDAPSHFKAGGAGLEGLRARDLIAPVVVIDFRQEAERNPDAELTPDHIHSWEAKHGQIPRGAVVALYTGWDARVGGASYIGLDEKGVKHFPGIGVDAALFLADQRDVWGIAVDTISFDPGPDGTYATHRALLGKDRWALEAVANLGRLPPRGATLFIGAPRVPGATGGPTRLIAMVPRNAEAFAGTSASAELSGEWESVAGEPLGTGPGTTYLRRRFTFEADRWSINFTLSKDAAGVQPLLAGTNAGRLVVASGPVGSIRPATFGFEVRQLTPLSPEIATALSSAGCGGSGWTVGETREVGGGGCPAFRVPAVSACAAEHDVVHLQGERLLLGARPAKGDLCDAERRPRQPGPAALQRVRQSFDDR